MLKILWIDGDYDWASFAFNINNKELLEPGSVIHLSPLVFTNGAINSPKLLRMILKERVLSLIWHNPGLFVHMVFGVVVFGCIVH